MHDGGTQQQGRKARTVATAGQRAEAMLMPCHAEFGLGLWEVWLATALSAGDSAGDSASTAGRPITTWMVCLPVILSMQYLLMCIEQEVFGQPAGPGPARGGGVHRRPDYGALQVMNLIMRCVLPACSCCSGCISCWCAMRRRCLGSWPRCLRHCWMPCPATASEWCCRCGSAGPAPQQIDCSTRGLDTA